MNVVIVPGYGDRTDYIERITAHWPEKYGLEPHIHPFGTTGSEETYDSHWHDFENVLEELGQTAIIGVSFGVGIAARAIQDYPDIVNRIVGISGPHRLQDLNPKTVDNKYPILKKSLTTFDTNTLPVEKIMTFRPLFDNVIAPRKVIIPGAMNYRVPAIGHGPGIFAALAFRTRTIAKFVHEDTGKAA